MEKSLFFYAKTIEGLAAAVEKGTVSFPLMGVVEDMNGFFARDLVYNFVPKEGNERQILTWKEGGPSWQYLPGLEEILAYGIQWSDLSATPARAGNMSLHKSLPIQSQIRGCIAQAGKVIYWLNESDWRFKKDADIISINLTVSGSDYTIVNSLFSDLRYEGAYLKIYGVVCKIASIDVDTNTATLETTEELINLGLTSGVKEVEFGSVLNGYDGTVRVYCPGFYIKSVIDGDTYTVWISQYRIDNTWIYQKEILVDAYRSTVLNTVPTNMGYLSTLPVNSAISVVNTHDYCRGGDNRSKYDVYLETDPCRSDLGKPRTNLSRATMRTYARNAGSEMLSYDLYKNIFYWLYAIEYADLDCQAPYHESLLTGGYKYGGLGNGVTGIYSSNWNSYNNYYPLTPCGYCNEFGNGIGLKTMTVDTGSKIYNFQVPRWRGFDNPFGDICTNLDGIIIQGSDIAGRQKTVYTTTDPNKYGDDEAAKNAMKIAGYEIYQDGNIKEFDLGEAAHIIPNLIGGNVGWYMGDYHLSGIRSTDINPLIVGGSADDGQKAGLVNFNSSLGMSYADTDIGFRTVSTSVSFPE